MKFSHDIIVRPLITEKSLQATQDKRYTFEVAKDATKPEIAKAVEEIENTTVGNKIKRKKNLQQVMKESFFYGANRFGNNFIA